MAIAEIVERKRLYRKFRGYWQGVRTLVSSRADAVYEAEHLARDFWPSIDWHTSVGGRPKCIKVDIQYAPLGIADRALLFPQYETIGIGKAALYVRGYAIPRRVRVTANGTILDGFESDEIGRAHV